MVILTSEVWDLRNFKLLQCVPSLYQTVIKFNGGGDVIYAILRRNHRDISSAIAPRRMKHSLVSAFRTLDSLNYSDIATIPVDHCVLDFATEPTDSVVGLIAVDYNGDMKSSSARIYDIGERKPIDGDYDRDLDVKYMYERGVVHPLVVQFNRNWNNDGDYDQDMINLGEDGGESNADDFEENVNNGEEEDDDDDDKSDSDLSLNIYMNFGADVDMEIESIRTRLDAESLHTYSIGLRTHTPLDFLLYAPPLVARMKDALTYGLPTKLMQYLRSGVLDDVKTSAIDDDVS